MIDTFLGLPTHPLLVHAVVALLPLTAILTVASAWAPTKWRSLTLPVVVLDATFLLLVYVTKESGEKLEHRLPRTERIHEHAELGEKLPVLVGLLFLCAVALLVVRRRARPGPDTGGSTSSLGHRPAMTLTVAVVTTVVAVAVIALTVAVGHSGAASVWSELPPRR